MSKQQIIKDFLDSLIEKNLFEKFQDQLSLKDAQFLHNYISKSNYLDSISEAELENFYNSLLHITDGEFDKYKFNTKQF